MITLPRLLMLFLLLHIAATAAATGALASDVAPNEFIIQLKFYIYRRYN